MVETPFRLLTGLGLGLTAAAVVPFRLRARTAERLDRTREGWPILLGVRGVGLAAVAFTMTYLVAPSAVAFAHAPFPAWLRLSGFGMMAGGAAFTYAALSHLGRNLTDTVVTRREHHLVTTGPYAWMRHPFYVGYLVIWLGAFLLTANLGVGLTNAVVWTLLVIRTRTEDRLLQERFGDAYADYRRRVGPFWPKRGPSSE